MKYVKENPVGRYEYLVQLEEGVLTEEIVRTVKEEMETLKGVSCITLHLYDLSLCSLSLLSWVKMRFGGCKICVWFYRLGVCSFESYREYSFILRSLGISFIGEFDPLCRSLSSTFFDGVLLKRINGHGLDSVYVFSERGLMDNYREEGSLGSSFYDGRVYMCYEVSPFNGLKCCSPVRKVVWVRRRGVEVCEEDYLLWVRYCVEYGIKFICEEI